MRFRRTIWVASALLFASVLQAKAQESYGSTIGNFLNIPVSPQMLAMGDAGVSVLSKSAASMIDNPAQLGIRSLTDSLNVGTSLFFHDSNTSRDGLYYRDESAANAAVSYETRVNSLWHNLPFRVGIGIGYSYQEFTFHPTLDSPEPVGYETDYANTLFVGLGLHYFLRLGLGYSLELVNNENRAARPKIDELAENFGTILQVPVLHLLWAKRQIVVGKDVEPILNIAAGYALRNVGGYVIKTPTYELPLARQALLGWNWELGFRSKVKGYSWKWFSFTWTRQAIDSPIKLDSAFVGGPSDVSNWNYFESYRGGLGDFSPWSNLILGKGSLTQVTSRGWQIGFAGFFYLRGGAIMGSRQPTYGTSGWGVSAEGLVKLMVYLHQLNPKATFTQFMLRHLDIEFDYSEADGGIFAGKPFESLDLVLR